MAYLEHLKAQGTRLKNRLHARLAANTAPATGFVSQPEPRTIGLHSRGQQIISGNFLFAGSLVEDKEHSIWQLEAPDAGFEEEIHGFVWLDDLAAVGNFDARRRAQQWVFEWIEEFGRGRGPGWTPDMTGRRLIRWINHAILLLNGQPSEKSEAYFKSLAHQTVFLSRRWHVAAEGLPRFEALTGLIYSGLAITGMSGLVETAVKALARECREQIDEEGGIPTRNPEELLEVFTLLNWAAAALTEAGKMAPRDHLAAIERIAPTLRALRHSDGSLARFHGGGRGVEGRLDHALAASGVKTAAPEGLSMGYARLHSGRTTLIVDAAAPPQGTAAYNAHASTVAFELTSGRRPVIVNCGSGATFGEAWRRASRATASHSTLSLDGLASARIGRRSYVGGYERELLTNVPTDVRVQYLIEDDIRGIVVGHNGYLPTHGLTHIRQLELSASGRGIVGEDTLAAISAPDKRRFDKVMDKKKLKGIGFKIRFHMHPDVEAELDMGGTAISLTLKSGEVWVFRHDGHANLDLEPSVYLEKGRLKPRATKQVVLSAVALEYATRIRWTLAKAQTTPDHVRDLEREDSVALT